MAGAVAGLEAGEAADHFHVAAVLTDGLGDEVIAPAGDKGGIGGGKGDEALFGKAAGGAHHQLLGHAHIVEVVREGVPEDMDVGVLGQVRAEADDAVVLLGQLHKGVAEGLGHGGMIGCDVGITDNTLNTH